MKMKVGSWAVLCVLASAATAGAQTASTEQSRFIAGAVGVGFVEKASFSANLDAGMRVWKNLSIVLEGSALADAVSRRQLDRADIIGDVIEGIEGQPVDANVSVPVWYGGIGARWTFESLGSFNPYVQITGGGVTGRNDPSFILGGTDITGSLPDYGVTLGEDLDGTFRSGAFTGTVGLTMDRGSYFFQGTIRLLSFTVSGGRTTATSLGVGGGFRF